MAVAVVASSCQKDLGGSPDSPVVPGAVPADFDWKTTRNVTVSVSAPVVEGTTPPYAVIRIYSSPILSAENLAARGVAKSAMPFRSAFTLPAGTENLYVQTTLPDGTKSVKMVGAHGTVAVTGASMKAAAAPKMRLAANARIGSSMPDYPKMEAPDAASFDSKAVITAIESGKSYQLGASWAFYAAPEYLIPAGAEVAGKLDLNGGFSPYQAPILYVAGKLTLSSLNIGRAKLAVLPGGEVKIGTLKIQPSAADGAAVYVFADGKLSVGKPNVSGKCIVNNGTLTVDGSLDMNNGLTVYNTATAVLTVTDEMKVSNSARIYNDGAVTVDDLKINSDGEFHNCENALLVVNDECELERSTAIYQRGRASIEEMTARGTIWVNCHTSVNELEAQGAEFNFSANAGLDAGRVEFNNTNVSMARGAIFTMEEYNADEKGGGNRFTFTGDADPRAVVLISEKAYTRKGHETYFSGAIEVVYDNDRDEDYTIRKDYLTDGAVMSASQTTIIAENGCNGGKDPVNPDPEPEPDEYANVPGRTYTYCFEDNWPWLGDYDMNDVVIVSRIDRMMSKDGGKVSALTINWELRAAGTTYDIAGAVQMDKVQTSDVAGVVSSHEGFGSGAFASRGLDADSPCAVIPFFNRTEELLSASNTWKGQPAAAIRKHTTTVTFSQPVDIASVLDSEMNFFIAPKQRTSEIHMPGYAPTASGIIGKGSFLPSDPYKFFVTEGDQTKNNYMMWALMIPGEFRYPAETNDIRGVYEYFMAWASSNGAEHAEWYLESADAGRIY